MKSNYSITTRAMTCAKFSLTALITIALPVSVWASTLALTPADSGTMGGADAGGSWGNWSPTISFVFQVSTPIDVTALGYYFHTENPLGGGSGEDSTHSLALARWNGVSLDAPLASTIVGLGSSVFQSSLNHSFAYENVAPVALTLGNTYMLSAAGSDIGDFFYLTSNYGPAPEIVFIEWLWGTSTPTGGTNAASYYFGPDLFYTPTIPEPSTCATLAIGVGVLAIRLGRRKKAGFSTVRAATERPLPELQG